jgi:hypothetical protein
MVAVKSSSFHRFERKLREFTSHFVMEGVSKIGFFLKDDIKEWREELSICCLLVRSGYCRKREILWATSLGVNFFYFSFFSTLLRQLTFGRHPLILSSSFMAFYFH